MPIDDHGPVDPPPKPIIHKTDSSPDKATKLKTALEREEEERKKHRAEEFKREMEKQLEYSPQKRALSEKSAKTDKSWSTVKTKTSDGKETVPPTKSKTSYEIPARGNISDRSNKRREVTIVDPKSVKRYDTDDEEEPFLQEFEYRRDSDFRNKTFYEMTDEEKVTYFRDHLKMKPDQIRELTFHPKVTESKTIHRAYTGIETGAWNSLRLKFNRRPKSRKVYANKKVMTIAPNQRKNYVHSRLQGVMYRHINNVYGMSPRENREKRFFDKLAQMQTNEMQDKYEKQAERKQKNFESKQKQRDQLRQVRKKFEDDAWRRFMTQYVTSKVVEAEYKDRKEYGLPNELGRERQRTYHGPSRRTRYTLTPKSRHKSNLKKYGNLFRFNIGPEAKSGGRPPKFDGIDTVYIDTEDENGKLLENCTFK